uniref:Uncharacterized protein n=1 Tax=Romanomermis culicivorax TaxID=13658 RepID=A0A915KCG4_ROMCU
MTGDVSVVLSYQPMEGTPAPLAYFATQGPTTRITMDFALEVIDSSSITDAMRAIWSTDLAKKYPHLPWALLNEPFEVEAMSVDKILLDSECSWPAVDAIRQAVEQASHNAQPTAVIAALSWRTMTGAQMLVAIAQQQPVAATTNSPTEVANPFGETLCAVNDNVSIIGVSPFPTATAPQSPKIVQQTSVKIIT